MKKYLSIMLVLLLVGCSTFAVNTYKSEYTTASAYDVGMRTVVMLQYKGMVTDEQREIVNKSGVIFVQAFNVAVDALATYSQVENAATKQMVITSLTNLLIYWKDLANLINTIHPNTVPTQMLVLKGGTMGGEDCQVEIKKLDSGQIAIIIQIGGAIVEYILPHLGDIITVFSKDSVTTEEILMLKQMVKMPTEY